VSTGLIALLDDISVLVKVAAKSLDDAGAQAAKASGKAAGIVIDDAAVTPRYVVGLAADRELPIIRKIATGSLKNKLLFLLPGALLLSFLAPWSITPLLMAGGAFLCLEGYHKVMDFLKPGDAGLEKNTAPNLQTAEEIENERVAGAIRTDFILSAEIMAITLDSVAAAPIWLQGVVLAMVGISMTLLVYGAVAVIVKADDLGVALAQSANRVGSALGRGIVVGMPFFLKALTIVGMVAMLWVGGGIMIHGLHLLGVHGPEEMVQHAAKTLAASVPAMGGLVSWSVGAGIAGLVGLVIGAVVDPLARISMEMVNRISPSPRCRGR
jgi:uncharacterized protein